MSTSQGIQRSKAVFSLWLKYFQASCGLFFCTFHSATPKNSPKYLKLKSDFHDRKWNDWKWLNTQEKLQVFIFIGIIILKCIEKSGHCIPIAIYWSISPGKGKLQDQNLEVIRAPFFRQYKSACTSDVDSFISSFSFSYFQESQRYPKIGPCTISFCFHELFHSSQALCCSHFLHFYHKY